MVFACLGETLLSVVRHGFESLNLSWVYLKEPAFDARAFVNPRRGIGAVAGTQRNPAEQEMLFEFFPLLDRCRTEFVIGASLPATFYEGMVPGSRVQGRPPVSLVVSRFRCPRSVETICRGRPVSTSSVAKSRRKSCGVKVTGAPSVHEACMGCDGVQYTTDVTVGENVLCGSDQRELLDRAMCEYARTSSPITWPRRLPVRTRILATAFWAFRRISSWPRWYSGKARSRVVSKGSETSRNDNEPRL